MNTRRIAIIGAGVAGLGPAWQLAKRGWHVEVFEQSRLGEGASARAAGMLAPVSEVTFAEDQLLRLSQYSHSLYPRFIQELQADSGRDLDYQTRGTLLVAIDRDDAEKLEHLYQFQRRLELPVERLTKDKLHELEPGLAPSIHYGLFSPQDHLLDPRQLLFALRDAFLSQGGLLHEEQGVDKILLDDQKIHGLITHQGQTHHFDTILLATGAWTRKIKGLPPGILPHIRPVRGQMLVVGNGTPPLIQHVIRAPDAYLVPRSDGRLLIGATMEEKGFDPHLTAGGVMDLLVGAFEAVPGIYDAPILDTWTGFRPISLANEPVIGPTSISGLHFALGFGRNGIVLTPAATYGLTTMLEDDTCPAPLRPFAPS